MGRVEAMSFAWGAAEGSVFFVIPDVLVCYVALVAPRRATAAYLAAVSGALVGAALLHTVSRPMRRELERLFVALPGIRAADVEEAAGAIARRGPAALVQLPLTSQPIKLYVHQASVQGWPLCDVLPFVALNRLIRLGAFAALYAGAGSLLRRHIDRRPKAIALAYVALWSAGYVTYWRRRSG